MSKRVVISTNSAWNISNFRTGLVRGLIEAGYEVIAIAPTDDNVPKIEALGCKFVPMQMDNKGTNPFKDFFMILKYWRLLRKERADILLGYTIKPNIYGSLAARLQGIAVINNISGLGTAFIHDSLVTKIVKLLYRVSLSRSACVFFQNNDDRTLFIDEGIVSDNQTGLLPGSGIDLSYYAAQPLPTNSAERPVVFLLIARLLFDKGIREYFEAAQYLRMKGVNARFQVLGYLDVENRTAVSHADMEEWTSSGAIEYLGSAEDVRPHIGAADCIVLPSYREGTPRTLLEGAAMGRPLIATDVPGCRECVEHGKNGYLCKVRSAEDLASKLESMAQLLPDDRQRMGDASRLEMETRFDEKIVVKSYLEQIERVIAYQN